MAGCMLVIDGSLDGHAVPQTNQRKEGNPASTPKCPVETRDVVITHTSARMQQQAGCRLERVSTGSAPSLPPWRAKRAPAPPHLCVTLASKYHLSIGSELVSASQFRCTSKSVDRLVRRVLANHEGCAGGGGAQQEGIVSGSALWIEGRAWVVLLQEKDRCRQSTHYDQITSIFSVVATAKIASASLILDDTKLQRMKFHLFTFLRLCSSLCHTTRTLSSRQQWRQCWLIR